MEKCINKQEQFLELVKKEMTMVLATSADGEVTMRAVSPAYYNDQILLFTSATSLKYQQLKKNPNCCIYIKGFFVQAKAEFLGSTMLSQNSELRDVYSTKFPGAFDETIEFGGCAADFVLLKPTRIKGWAFVNDVPTPDGVPTVPFDIEVK